MSDQPTIALPSREEQLKRRLQDIVCNQNLQSQRALLTAWATDLAVDTLDCGAALLYVIQQDGSLADSLHGNAMMPLSMPIWLGASDVLANFSRPLPATVAATPVIADNYMMPNIKMVRYRLDIGKNHLLTVKELKKVLIEESGVDKNNIKNVMIHADYTLIELPDEMPQDIFQHLKAIEINHQKLNIKRVKPRIKKQANKRYCRGKQRKNLPNGDTPDKTTVKP